MPPWLEAPPSVAVESPSLSSLPSVPPWAHPHFFPRVPFTKHFLSTTHMQDLLREGPSHPSSFGLDSMPSAFSLWPWAAPSITKANVSDGAVQWRKRWRGSERAHEQTETKEGWPAAPSDSDHLSIRPLSHEKTLSLLGWPLMSDSRLQ